jgi:CheY-like chemotaxis protein
MGLPDVAGIDVLRSLRERTDAPVIVVSGNDSSESVSQALMIGADDYITKPFIPIELMALVDAVTRRSAGKKVERTSFTINDITLDFDRKQAIVAGANVELNLTGGMYSSGSCRIPALWSTTRHSNSRPGTALMYPMLRCTWQFAIYDKNSIKTLLRNMERV